MECCPHAAFWSGKVIYVVICSLLGSNIPWPEGDHTQAVWVFFEKRVFATSAERDAALERRLHELSPQAICRRALRRTDAGLLDERDLPVPDEYVASVRRI